MGALLIHDISSVAAVTNPVVPLENQVLLFSSGAFHGGIWRNAFTIDSIGAVAAAAFYAKKYASVLTAVGAGFIAWASWLAK